uniref:Uncharacterized protein n=1 Tax=Rhizophora mucronata TaxID=61149 RepID=A0A2P2KY25_RHIMU
MEEKKKSPSSETLERPRRKRKRRLLPARQRKRETLK